jgi:preprotein translocase subunit SecA
VPAQGGPGGAHARGAAPTEAGDGRGAQGGTATPRRDGRASGAQAPKRDGRVSSAGAHARRAGNAPEDQSAPIPAGLTPRRPQRLQYSAPSVDGGTHVETSKGPAVNDDFARVGRNDPCPCGSGRKFKRCHGDPRTRPDA